jgi:hypothetical protein
MIDDKAYHVSDYPQFKVSLNMLNLTFDENNPIMDNDKVYGGISYQLKIQDLLNGVSSVFNKVQDTLLKEVTDDMINYQINRIIDGCKVFFVNMDKLYSLKYLQISNLVTTSTLETLLIIAQIVDIILFKLYIVIFNIAGFILALEITLIILSIGFTVANCLMLY